MEHSKILLFQLLEQIILHSQKPEYAPGSCYRSILSSGSYYLEDFDYRSILVDSGIIVHCTNSILVPPVLNFMVLFFLNSTVTCNRYQAQVLHRL